LPFKVAKAEKAETVKIEEEIKDIGGGSSAHLEPLDNLAHAVAVAETSNCTAGYALSHNNCHGIKKGNTYPCKLKPGSKSKMCYFKDRAESFKAFKIIWAKWYKNIPPTRANADIWTGKDRAATWLKHVKANL
jgi:hypothetical protein